MLAGKKVFFVDDNRLAACFDASVGTETIEEICEGEALDRRHARRLHGG